jgi:hypothetical protein
MFRQLDQQQQLERLGTDVPTIDVAPPAPPVVPPVVVLPDAHVLEWITLSLADKDLQTFSPEKQLQALHTIEDLMKENRVMVEAFFAAHPGTKNRFWRTYGRFIDDHAV